MFKVKRSWCQLSQSHKIFSFFTSFLFTSLPTFLVCFFFPEKDSNQTQSRQFFPFFAKSLLLWITWTRKLSIKMQTLQNPGFQSLVTSYSFRKAEQSGGSQQFNCLREMLILHLQTPLSGPQQCSHGITGSPFLSSQVPQQALRKPLKAIAVLPYFH